jgi:hypothetical protein
MDEKKRKELRDFAGTVILAVLVYRISPVFFLFMIPLVWFYFNRGNTWFLYSGLATLAGILIVSLFLITGVSTQLKMYLMVLEISLPTSLIIGTWFLLHDNVMTKLRSSLIGIACIGILSVPLILFLRQSDELIQFFRIQVNEIIKVAAGEEFFKEAGLTAEGIFNFAAELVFKNYLASLYIMTTLAFYLTKRLYARYKRLKAYALGSFKLDDRYIWFFITGWFGVVVSVYLETGFAEYLFWNTAIIFLYLFGVQGIGIIQYLFEKYSVSKGARLAIVIGSIIGLLTPGINVLILFGVPVFGASEIWIHYRERSKGHEGHIE